VAALICLVSPAWSQVNTTPVVLTLHRNASDTATTGTDYGYAFFYLRGGSSDASGTYTIHYTQKDGNAAPVAQQVQVFLPSGTEKLGSATGNNNAAYPTGSVFTVTLVEKGGVSFSHWISKNQPFVWEKKLDGASGSGFNAVTTVNLPGYGPPPPPPRTVEWFVSGTKFGPASGTLALLVNGLTLPQTIPGNASPHGLPFDVTFSVELPANFVGGWGINWNSATVATGTVYEVSPIVVDVGNQGDSGGEPPPEAEPTEEQPAPGGTSEPVFGPPAPAPPPAAPPVAGGGGVGITGNTMGRGDVNVLNTNDFYAPFKQALVDAAATTGVPGFVAFSTAMPEVQGEQLLAETAVASPEIDSAKASLGLILARSTQLRDGLVAKMPGALSLPTSFGTDYVLNFNLMGPNSVDFTPFSTHLLLVRQLLLVVLVVSFWLMTVRTIKQAFA
jgi:hypothetical protein